MPAIADEYIPLSEASKLVPGNPHLSTLCRWAQKGVRGVKLETYRAGHRLFTTKEAIDKFLAKQSESDSDRLEAEGC